MNIISLPIEIQERILINVNEETKIELVCRLWNEICKKEVIVNRRFGCVCLELCLTAGSFDQCKSVDISVFVISAFITPECVERLIIHVFVNMAPITLSIVRGRHIRVFVKMILIVFITHLCVEA